MSEIKMNKIWAGRTLLVVLFFLLLGFVGALVSYSLVNSYQINPMVVLGLASFVLVLVVFVFFHVVARFVNRGPSHLT